MLLRNLDQVELVIVGMGFPLSIHALRHYLHYGFFINKINFIYKVNNGNEIISLKCFISLK